MIRKPCGGAVCCDAQRVRIDRFGECDGGPDGIAEIMSAGIDQMIDFEAHGHTPLFFFRYYNIKPAELQEYQKRKDTGCAALFSHSQPHSLRSVD
jgi:hypothetical protein